MNKVKMEQVKPTANIPVVRMSVLGLIVSSPSIMGGFVEGYATLALPQMKLSINEASWFSSIPYFGILIGAVTMGVLIDTIGRRNSVLTGLTTHFLGWTLLACNFNFTSTLIGRALTGLSYGSLFYPGQVYATECIAVHSKRWRSSMASWNGFTSAIGMCSIILMSYFLHYRVVAAIGAVTSLTLMIIIRTVLPESPIWLYMHGRVSEAEQALDKLRLGLDTSILNNLKTTEDIRETFCQKSVKKLKQLGRKDVYKPVLTLTIANIIFMFDGAIAVLTYQVDIIGSNPHANTEKQVSYAQASSVLSGFVILVSQIGTSFILPLIGARRLIFSCSICLATSMVLLGYSTSDQQNSSLYIWRSVAIWIIIGLFYFGIKPVPTSIASDSFPLDAKGFAYIPLALKVIAGGVLLKVHPFLWATFNSTLIYIYASCTIVGALYTLIFIQETVGKTLEEINERFRR